MQIKKLTLLKIVLCLGALYFLIGGFAHVTGSTIFPFYDGRMYMPYHDSVIALAALMFSFFLLVVARDPVKNKDMLTAIIISATLASLFSFGIIWGVDFRALGAPAKEFQTIVEGILGVVFVVALIWLYPHEENK